MLTGSLVAIATPMQPGGALDLPGLAQADRFPCRQRHRRHRRRRHDRRIADRQRRRALPADQDRGRARRRAHAGHRRHRRQFDRRSDRADRIRESRPALRYGLSVVPYYNKPSQEGLYRHFRSDRRSVDLPLSGLQRARPHGRRHRQRHGAAAGASCRASSASRTRPSDLGAPRRSDAAGCPRPKRFRCCRATTIPRWRYMLLGGHGVISVTANVAPRAMSEMCAAALAGDLEEARDDQRAAACRCTPSCSSRPIRFRSNGRWPRWA